MSGTRNQIRANAGWLSDVLATVDAGEEFQLADLPIGKAEFKTLQSIGVVTQLRREPGMGSHIWRITPDDYQLLEAQLADISLLPCGHPPFSNPRDREGYSCANPDCDSTYTRAEIREHR